jgi:hypothetical protein
MPLPHVMCGIVHLQVVGGTLQVAGSAPAAPQLAAVLPPEQVALLQSLRPLISQQSTGSQDNTGLPDPQVRSIALTALLAAPCRPQLPWRHSTPDCCEQSVQAFTTTWKCASLPASCNKRLRFCM